MNAPHELLTKPTLLVVDDTPDNLTLMTELLKPHYRVKVANSGEKALAIATEERHLDLILLDIMMPGIDGYEVCKRLKSDEKTHDIPVIFLTSRSEAADEELGLEVGAVDYITKPINPAITLARVANHLTLKASADFLKDKAAYLEQEVAKRTTELVALQDVTILTMASLAETRDSETGNHIRRTQFYVKELAEKLSTHPKFKALLTPAFIQMLFKSAPLHDIGKVGIPDRILLKPGKFEPHEFEIMKTHALLGKQVIEFAERQLGREVEFLTLAKEIAYCHHEKWNGSGYPQGLAGEDIPVSARLMAVADVYDALISRRVYKEGMSHEKAAAIIIEGRGQHFDPDMVDAFIELQDAFQAIAARFVDTDQVLAQKEHFNNLVNG